MAALSASASPEAFRCIRELVELFGGRVWRVSKAGPKVQERTCQWLERNDFWCETGLEPARLRFCRSRPEKASVAWELGLTHFVDDQPGVLVAMAEVVLFRFLFGAERAAAKGQLPAPGWPAALAAIRRALSLEGTPPRGQFSRRGLIESNRREPSGRGGWIMQRPVQLSWRRVPRSEAVTQHVQERVAWLERFYRRITGCTVTIEAPSRHHRHSGTQYRVRIELSVPGRKLVVGRDPDKTQKHSDLYLAVDAAFREARRQLEDHARRLDARVKTHASSSRAVVARLFPAEGHGFLATADGREIYFHERSVLGSGFSRLRVGSAVRFAEESGDEGPQASTVAPLQRRGGRARAPLPAPPVPDRLGQ